MRAVIRAPGVELDDLADLVARIRADQLVAHDGSPVFDRRRRVSVARAPGRLDVMGGIADYSGSLVLQWPLREATLAAVQSAADGQIHIESVSSPGSGVTFKVDVATLCGPGDSITAYADAQRLFAADEANRWAAYIVGVFLVLMRERGARFPDGARVYVESSVPEGKGVSSSAALEVAVMTAVADAFDLPLGTHDPHEIATLCQIVENRVVGAACGIMDQMAVACGQAGRLLALECRPATLLDPVTLPPELGVWGIDSGVRHAVTGSSYTDVRIGAAMGYRMIAEIAGLPATATADGRMHIADHRWQGYLANITPEEYEAHFRNHIPTTMLGSDFLAAHHGVADTVVSVDPDVEYAVRMPTAHPIYEHARVRAFADLLKTGDAMANAVQLGRLMYESHKSYSACGLGSAATDLLVDLVGEVGDAKIFGAKITGGGSGGTVAVLASSDAGCLVDEVAARFAERTGHVAHVFRGSSPGAGVVGAVRLDVARPQH